MDGPGSVAMVTGASAGIGAAVVREFLVSGAKVAALDVQPMAAGSQSERLLPLAADVTSTAAVRAAVRTTVEKLGRIDALVHCAGITRDGVLWKLSDEDWDRVIEVNLSGAFRVVREVIPVMRAQGGGSIVLVSSLNGLRGKFGQANYAASKAGLVALARTAALETGAFGVRVNVVAPGWVNTPMTAGLPEEFRQAALQSSVLRKLAEPEDIAGPIVFLCSPRSGHVTGTVLCVDGGQGLSSVPAST